MKTEIADIWTTALRSGEFKQGSDFLFNSESGSYCCLGVLCELAVKAGVVKKNEDGSYDEGQDQVLPDSVMDWAGMQCDSGVIPNFRAYVEEGVLYMDEDGKQFSEDYLTEMNDSKGLNFNQIADVIDKMKAYL